MLHSQTSVIAAATSTKCSSSLPPVLPRVPSSRKLLREGAWSKEGWAPTTPVPGKVGPCPSGAAAEWARGCVDCHVWGPPFHLFCQGESSHYLSWPGAPPLVSYLQLLELKKYIYPFLERKKKVYFKYKVCISGGKRRKPQSRPVGVLVGEMAFGVGGGKHLQQRGDNPCQSGGMGQVSRTSGNLGPANKMCCILPERRGLDKKEHLEF